MKKLPATKNKPHRQKGALSPIGRRVRASVLARGKKLLRTKGYPDKTTVGALAALLAGKFVEEGTIRGPIFGKN